MSMIPRQSPNPKIPQEAWEQTRRDVLKRERRRLLAGALRAGEPDDFGRFVIGEGMQVPANPGPGSDYLRK